MIEKVKGYIEQHHMLSKGDRITIGVSGGADSICLLTILLELREAYDLYLYVVHINHGLRGEEADGDEAFVIEYCNEHGIDVHTLHYDVKRTAKENAWSEEEAGRNIRYEAFFQESLRHNCNKIAIAHNKNDNAETVLFHLLRGSGINGMTGIKPCRDKIIRPLLNSTRQEIEEFLSTRGIKYRTDKTNLLPDYTRNKIRLSILPYAEKEINSKAMEHIVSMSSQLAEIAGYLERVTEDAYRAMVRPSEDYIALETDAFQTLDPVIQKSLLRKLIFCMKGQLKDIEEGHIIDIIALKDKQVGKTIDLPYHIKVKKTYQHIMFTDKIYCKESNFIIPVNIPSVYHLKKQGYTIQFELMDYKNSMNIPKNGYTKWFDYDKINDAVVIRTRETGDYLQINRYGGKKSLKSIFIDKKIPYDIRDGIPLICVGSHVMWILGNRTSEGFLVEEGTKRVLVIEVKINN